MMIALIIIAFLAITGFLATNLSVSLPYSTDSVSVLEWVLELVGDFILSIF